MKLPGNRDGEFYDLLEKQAAAMLDAANIFYELTGDFGLLKEHVQKLEQLEHDADAITHHVVNRVNTQFITPLDKEDLHGLTTLLDDVTDNIEAAASLIVVYRLGAPRPDLATLASMAVAIAEQVSILIRELRKGLGRSEVATVITGIHRMETTSDRAFRQALMALFDDEELDTRTLIKWKDIYTRVEMTINCAEKLAGFIEAMTVKYG